MAKEIENLNINGEIFEFSKIYAKMGLTFERFVELIGRDLYCPTMDSEPTSSTLTYQDTDGSVNNFQIGQMCRWSDGNGYRVAICTSATPIETSWYVLPKEMSNVQAVDTADELDDVETNTYLKYTAQNLTEAQKAQARANIGVSAGNSSSGGSGTITGVSANGTSIATSGVANIPAATTSKYGVTQLSSSTSSTSTSLAATPSAVKAAYDLANGKQDKLISGTNIKTINGTSILGSGDITIEGGVTEEYVNNAIASAITTTLNTAV